MSGLPASWLATTLGSVIDYGKTIKAEPDQISDETWVLELEDVEKDTSRLLARVNYKERQSKSTKNRFDEGDVLYGKLRPYLNKVLIADRPGVCTTEIIPLSGGPTLDNRYLFYWLKNPKLLAYVETESHGMNMPRLGTDAGKAAPFVLAPLPEQKRIADKLDRTLARVDACRNRLDRLPAILKRFRQSVLAAATSGKLTEDWRASRSPDAAQRNPGAASTDSIADASLAYLKKTQQAKKVWLQKNSTHNEAARVKKRLESFSAAMVSGDGLPDSWCWAALEDAVLMVVDCHNKTAPYEPEGIALVRTTNVRDGRFVWDDLRFVSDDTYQFWSKRCLPESGDIVFTREAPMGEAAIIPAGTQICLGQRTMLIRPIREVTSEDYLLIALLDPMFKARAELIAVGTGVKHLRVGDVSELKLPLPPTDEQHEIVRRVETLFAFADRLEARLTTARKQVDQLTPALLAKAFRGELVPQDPNDEPATELLKRLAADRLKKDEAAPKAKRGRKIAS